MTELFKQNCTLTALHKDKCDSNLPVMLVRVNGTTWVILRFRPQLAASFITGSRNKIAAMTSFGEFLFAWHMGIFWDYYNSDVFIAMRMSILFAIAIWEMWKWDLIEEKIYTESNFFFTCYYHEVMFHGNSFHYYILQ